MRLVAWACGVCGTWAADDRDPGACDVCGCHSLVWPRCLVFETRIAVGAEAEHVRVAHFAGLWEVGRRERVRALVEDE